MGYRIINGVLYPIGDFSNLQDKKNITKNEAKESKSFDDIFKSEKAKNQGFTLSNHSAKRLKERNIELSGELLDKINEGINKASEKGSREALILYKDMALIASIKNRTIITAMEKSKDEINVVTNVDSVVLL
ncbi:TIGR02530 family flagellar biosynthesis protein [Clostridium senegalense]|uniref:TIGR02530 family flagellar biosynthesis protein n=1 Tax=Clostridium senegalense TaxID=1465809 RepID=UPI000288D083|nr:TIGR02530 family flagellar biosynthesis protein [Clostridium senegalense]MBU5225379.1 flagellar biosynthesis protein [Clostridium senegalense]